MKNVIFASALAVTAALLRRVPTGKQTSSRQLGPGSQKVQPD